MVFPAFISEHDGMISTMKIFGPIQYKKLLSFTRTLMCRRNLRGCDEYFL
jgi:hypothetical protein